MDSKRENLTNEKLKERFSSQFDLVNYAIRLAEDAVATGRVSRRAVTDNQNIALEIMMELSEESDLLEKDRNNIDFEDEDLD